MEDFQKRFQKLNKEQKESVENIEGPMLVVAGPGSGKTELLSLRAANILKKTDVFPGNILCLTFTDSAAFNMRERLKEMIGDDAYRIAVHTFHNFGVEIMEEHRELFYQGALFSSIDELTQMALLEEMLSQLPHNNPLSQSHPEQGYIYLNSIKDSLRDLKKAGLTPEEFKKILRENKKSLSSLNTLINKAFQETVTKKTFKKIKEILKEMEEGESPLPNWPSLNKVVKNSLEKALQKAEEEEKTAPLSQWKKNWTKKKDSKRVLKETFYQEKMEALADLYREYRELLYNKGYYDFDDMILEAIKAIEKNEELKAELQEQYQYILVDEFQDTNEAQMRLLRLLTDNPVTEGSPNIMAVGDDDQAVYKFQGAEISNILKFRKYYRQPRIICLTKNYRSGQEILDLAREVIKKGENRLERIIPELNKELIARKKEVGRGEIISRKFPTKSQEYFWTAKEVRKLIDQGEGAEEIALIARTNKELEEIVPFLNKEGINVSYERKKNVLNDPQIIQIIKIARFIDSLLNKSREEADYLLPEILSFPFWKIKREDLWKLSLEAKGKPWLEGMLQSKNSYLKEIAHFFLNLSAKAKYQPVEEILDDIVGAKIPLSPDSEDLDLEEHKTRKGGFASPFKDYYFSRERFEKNPGSYLNFLSSLRTFVYSLREYKKGQFLKLKDLIEFLDIHAQNKIPLLDKNPFIIDSQAVKLVTAHKAKGSEFKIVFVLNCQEESWAKSKRRNILAFPANLPISPAGDNLDDQLRLFYVTVSRTKEKLYLTSFKLKENGKESDSLHFLNLSEKELKTKDVEEIKGGINDREWSLYHYPPLTKNEEVFLQPLLERYQLNVTHLNNFLNVSAGGPQKFLEDNLLRFPQPKTPALSYGTAMHLTLEEIYRYLKKEKKPPSLKKVEEWFGKILERERLNPREFKFFFKKGKDALKKYFQQKKGEFRADHIIEFNFRNQGSTIKGVPLSGKIDRLVEKDGEMEVHDFKTGRYSRDWKGRTKHEKIKLWKYESQLSFYKILVENSRKFKGRKKVKKGRLEFLEPDEKGKIINLSLEIEKDYLERLEKLIEKVYNKIMKLDFPRVDDYPKDIKGIKQFEEDILNNKI